MEAMQYETARNMTLLFFFERLLDKGEPRTLHDLSCQFGSKGFTKEMRQIAGGSQSGLKKFLSQYPSLFCMDNDYVTVNTFQHSSSKDSQGKDYTTQAVEYFSEKLAQYGEGTEVPIRSLLGHRSQASPEVRHVSGQHFHEFRDFLFKHPGTFMVDDEKETVILANFESVKSHCPPELHFQHDVKIDPQETQALLDFLAQCIEVKGPVLVEQLFQIVSCNLPESMWTNLFNTPTQLMSFLRLFSDSFHIHSNLVTLIQPPKINQKHMSAQVNLMKEYKRTNEEMKNAKNLSIDVCNDVKTDKVERIEKREKPLTLPMEGIEISEKYPSAPMEKDNIQLSPRSISDRLKQPKIQAKSMSPEPPTSPVPPAVSYIKNEDKSKVNFKLGNPIKQNSNENQNDRTVLSPTFQKPSIKSNSTYNQSLKQRINTLVLKTLQENTGREQRQSMMNQHITHTDSWKTRLFQNTRVICTTRECQLVINDIMNKEENNKFDETWPFTADRKVVAFDCEGINLGVKGQLTLMQVATMTGFAYVFDLISCPEMIEHGLRRLLESNEVIKVVHDCRNDSVNLYNQFNIMMRMVFDTQAAHAILTYQETNRPVYKAKSIALNALCECYGAPINPMKDQLKTIYRRDQKYWSRRPLSREMILYASADVLSLTNEKIYYQMSKNIRPENRELLLELCDEQLQMHISPDSVKMKKRQRKTETEVMELRTKLAQATKSVVLSNREVRLLRYIELTDDEKEKLKSSAKVAKKLEKLESLGQDREGDSSEEDGDNDQDYPSLDSDMTSPRNSEPTSLTESMQMVDTILNDNKLDRIDKIEKLETILSNAAILQNDIESEKCTCSCHCKLNNGYKQDRVVSPTNEYVSSVKDDDDGMVKANHSNIGTQTLSTGDIVVTKIFFNESTE
ncbi:uncharacterized protein LOC130444815 isoform X1 [Diorhabda sublineata]|uniref:uncharacterized protein LOC130444815 isoform X1 n=1 Tax=Diorhabda sublineata TaxID=1163346 RepID=UPI0024E18E41|nr:uncharacterized protein LOC130444815 isoform X1 [Diorhabda sublineata]